MNAEKVVLYRYTCERCGHKWLPRSEERPIICPKCKSARWDEPKSAEIK